MIEKELPFEERLWKAADKLRKKIEVHEYKYIVLGLIFLRYLSFIFEEYRKLLKEELLKNGFPPNLLNQALEDKDRYLAEGVFYLEEDCKWDYFVKNVNQKNIGEIIDNAIEKLEREYPNQLKDVIPKKFTQVNLDHYDLAYLINLFTDINFGDGHRARDIFGRIYEYFLGKFADKEGKRGGEYYTPRSLTKLIVEVLDIKEGRIFDPACGSGGFFIAAVEKLEREGIDRNMISIYGQDSKENAYKLCKMNLAIRGIEGDIRVGDSYHDDKFIDLRADYVLSNPPFNDSEWGADRINPYDPRFKYGIPPNSNANFAWIQHFIHHLAPNGKAGFVMANGALSAGGSEGKIREGIVKDDLIYGIVACPPKLFYNVSLPVSLWFLRKNKPEHMKGKVLFIYAKKIFMPISRRQNILTDEHINKIVEKFRLFEKGESEDKINEIGFSKIVEIDEIAKNGYILTPGRYVGIRLDEEDEPFNEKMIRLIGEFSTLINEEKELNKKIQSIIESIKHRYQR